MPQESWKNINPPDGWGTGPLKTLDQLAQAVIADFDPSNGGNFRQLAEQYGMTLLQMHNLIHARRPDLYQQYLDRRSCAEKSSPAFHAPQPDISAASTPSRTSHRTDRAASNQKRWGSLKKWWRTKRVGQSPANTATAPRTGCSVHITGDIAGLSLSISPANGQALELVFSSDVHNADKRRSCRD